MKLGNTLADYAIDATHTQLQTGKMALMEHPEDLGKCPWGGVPAAIWQFAECNSLLEYPGVLTLGLLQSSFGTDYLKPTRLGRWPGMETLDFVGPPQFDEEWSYKGPIPRSSNYKASLVRRASD